MQKEFFGSKLNTWLLLILIILMIVALKFMWAQKKTSVDTYVQNRGNTETMPAIEGSASDLVSFSIKPGAEVGGVTKVTGTLKNGYFFEGNVVLNILDKNKKLLKTSPGTATTDWMTSGPVSFEGTLDFSGLAKGLAFVEIHNDNPSDLLKNDKSILIQIIIK